MRHDALGRVHDEDDDVHPGGAGEHILDKPFVPGNVDKRDARSVGKVEVGEAEVDSQPALFLFLQAVGIDISESLYQRGLAVVYMACGAYNEMLHR